MGDPHLIGPVPRTSSAKSSGGRSPRALPDDLLRDASRRLGIMSLVAAGLWIVATILGHLAVRSMSHGDPQWLASGRARRHRRARASVASVLLFFYTRRSPITTRGRMLDLGLALHGPHRVRLGLMFHWEPMPADAPIAPEISWIGAVVLMFAAIVPSTPGKTAVAGAHRRVDEPGRRC